MRRVATHAFVLPLLLLAGCGLESRVCEVGEPFTPSQREDGVPFGLVRCDVLPELCDLNVVSHILEPDLDLAIDLVFVPDGYGADGLEDFHARVDELVVGARSDPQGIMIRDPALFNVHRVESTAPLGTCTVPNELGGGDSLSVDWDRVYRAGANAPDADVLIVVSRDVAGRANARNLQLPPIVSFGADYGHRTLTHELGHAIFNLADEYTHSDEEHPLAGHRTTLSRIRPNASVDPEETWGGLVEGTVEGAMQYGRGIYKPTDACLMGAEEQRFGFCPVCDAHITEHLAARRGQGTSPPTCGFFYTPVDEGGAECTAGDPGCGIDGRAVMRVIAWDADGLAEVVLLIDDQELPLPLCAALGECGAPTLVEQDVDATLGDTTQLELRCVDGVGDTGGSALTL